MTGDELIYYLGTFIGFTFRQARVVSSLHFMLSRLRARSSFLIKDPFRHVLSTLHFD